MSEIAIRAEGISKRYRIGEGGGARYVALRDTLARALTTPLRMFRNSEQISSKTSAENTIWALKDVSFEVRQGEIIGLIGRNGAGKSTLLRVLTRITKPTSGRARIWGRVGSLLEVGTGFHPELTGRENVFLSGSILGMSRREIHRKFEEIVTFAGVEQFIDTPVKHYSTGMQTRLAFSVAAHLEPDVLLVDEVLAVGDLEFQKKCLGKMKEVSEGGRTVLLVSHQMNQIRRLCNRVIWIDAGTIRTDGPAAEVIGAYEAAQMDTQNATGGRCFHSWEIVGPSTDGQYCLASFGSVTVKFNIELREAVNHGHHGIALYDSDGQLVWGTAVHDLRLTPGRHEFVYRIGGLPLRPGAYRWRVSLYDDGNLIDIWDGVPELCIRTQPLGHPRDEWAGLLNIPWDFRVGISANGNLSEEEEVIEKAR